MKVLELVVNGEVVASAEATNGGTDARISREIRLDRSSWIAATVRGPANRLVINDPEAFAHTSPVYCYIDNQKIAFARDAKIVVAWIDRVIQDIVASPRFATPDHRKETLAIFQKGRAYYETIASGR
jgi:hypothetical protein